MRLEKFIDTIFDFFLPKKTSQGLRQFLKYLFCGGVSTLTDMFVLYVSTHFLGINHLVAAAAAFVAGVATNYSLNTMLVFKSSGKIKRELSLFVIIGVGGLLWTETILWILVDNMNFKIMIAKMIAVILVLNWNFFMRKKFVFRVEPNLETLEKSLG
ncbi:MAG: GtrA family protein [Candidatus Moranbacteria bacterium]|nr:GtrA family protein [Candidatus Moranbacteria bacterium]